MNPLENIKMAVKTLTANKLRSTLTVLGIVIGNASVVAMIGIGQGAQTFTQERVESLGANLLYVFMDGQGSEVGAGDPPQLLLSDAEAIAAQAPAVKLVSPMISASLTVNYQSRTTKATVQGITPDFLPVRNMQMTTGRFWDEVAQRQDATVVVLGAELSQKLFNRTNPIGQEIQIGDRSFQVIGVLQRKGAALGVNPDVNAFIPITTMANQLVGRSVPGGMSIDEIEISAKDQASIRAAAFQVTNILTRLRGKQDFLVVANKSVQDLLRQITEALSIMLAAIAGISLLVGGIGIMNIMLVSVTERTQEIGLRKAIGAPEQSILQQFLIEAVTLSIAGGIIGISIGVGSAVLVGVFTPLKPTVPFSAIVLATGVSGGIGLIFGVVPARQAAKLDPIVALRRA
ncbi:ABC transporter permease [Nodosilinea sp. LEGE 07298]|uniref:ABC transporter permease n=1 Tax=Nodosilinea sp. LEGE 07298 TaxID=2777970 RepID=UPI0018807294|nr:ABC transporter permease [Nodosilinea sp. LEGE 07298]MBE9109867.1 ABC transporter permease [Nodosilinea sp. LEGE 07298]